MDILGLVGTGLGLVVRIIKIIDEKGDAAGKMRLEDIPGWEELKKKCREKEAVDAFVKAWKNRKRPT